MEGIDKSLKELKVSKTKIKSKATSRRMLRKIKKHYASRYLKKSGSHTFIDLETKGGCETIAISKVYDSYQSPDRKSAKKSIVGALYRLYNEIRWANSDFIDKDGHSIKNYSVDHHKGMALFQCLSQQNLSVLETEFPVFHPGLLIKRVPDDPCQKTLLILNGRIDILCKNKSDEIVIIDLKTMPPGCFFFTLSPLTWIF